MPYKDILVHVDAGERCRERIDVACRLAAAHKAHLTGLCLRGRQPLPDLVMAGLGPDVAALLESRAHEQLALAEQQFLARAEGRGIPVAWRVVEGDPARALTASARQADLTILGQNAPTERRPNPLATPIGDVVLGAGRPVLVVPYAGTFPTVGERILVAWNGSREAARAMGDAMPLLLRAKKTLVLAASQKAGNSRRIAPSEAEAIAAHLARHGIVAEVNGLDADDIDVGALLLSRAAEEGCDLIVMGAYGRSRLRELVLGGVTRHLLRHMTVPVLMGR